MERCMLIGENFVCLIEAFSEYKCNDKEKL